MSDHQYGFSTVPDEVERERLQQQEREIDYVTIRHLETIGVCKGWRCLEVGAGAGSIAQWLATRVGSSGRVVATDIDLRFLRVINAPNLEVRQHNILKDDLETNQYDVVHCRKVLHHLPAPQTALQKMADAVRPGGWLLIEEDDYGSMLSIDLTELSAGPFVAAMRAHIDNLRKKGVADYYFGRRVRRLVEELGFIDVRNEGWTTIVRKGDPYADAYTTSFETAAKTLVEKGVIPQENFDLLRRIFVDTDLDYPAYTLFCAWGRKPR